MHNVSHEKTTPFADEARPTAEEAAETSETASDDQPAGDTAAHLVPVEQLNAARKEAQDYKEGWMRERADFSNYKKRVDNQMKDLRDNAIAEALVCLFPVIDDFERAMANVPEELKDNGWISGVSGIHRKFTKILEDQGMIPIDPVGQPFDPTRHEAVMKEDSDEIEAGHVIATLQKGYVRGERVLRPALVKVAN
jgi:molecular chaperone GrpE